MEAQDTQTAAQTAAVPPREPTAPLPDIVSHPYPILLAGRVSRGFGRGSRELGIPTANLPEEVAQAAGSILESGIYYGWAWVSRNEMGSDSDDKKEDKEVTVEGDVYPMVMSYGWNPYYKNSVRTAEVHIIHRFANDFYGHQLRVIVAGFIRNERNYTGVEALVADINVDIACAHLGLEREAFAALRGNSFFSDPKITTIAVTDATTCPSELAHVHRCP